VPDQQSDITFTPEGKGWTIRRTMPDASMSELHLTTEEALRLCETAPAIKQRILQGLQGTRSSIRPVLAIPVEAFHMPVEAIGASVLLTMQPPAGEHLTYRMAPQLALQLARFLVERVEEIQVHRPIRQ